MKSVDGHVHDHDGGYDHDGGHGHDYDHDHDGDHDHDHDGDHGHDGDYDHGLTVTMTGAVDGEPGLTGRGCSTNHPARDAGTV